MRSNRRQFMLGSAAALAAGTAGLRPAFAAASDMRQIFWGGQARADRTYKTNDLFAKANAGEKVTGEFYSWDDYWPKLATQTAGGNAPDIIQMDYRYIVEYASRQAIAPLDAFVGKELDLHDFDKDQIQGGTINGKLYGISLGANSVASVYNVAAFKEAGLPVPDASFSYDQMMDLGTKFKKANIRNGMTAFQDGSGVEPALENWLRQRGKALYTADGKLGFTADDLTAWFQMWKDYRDAGIIPTADNQALDTGGPLDKTMIALGKSAQSFVNSNQLVAVQAIMKDPVTIGSFPRIDKNGKGGHYRKPSMFWSVAGASKIPADAAKYVSFFINNVDANKVLGVERGIPAAATVRDAIAPGLSAQDQVALKFVANLGDLLGPIPPPPPKSAGEVDVQLLPKSQEVAFGQSSPQDAGPAFVKQASDILSRKSEPAITVRPIGATTDAPTIGRTVNASIWTRFWRRNGAGYAFLTPWLLGFFFLTIGPALISLYLSFTDFNLLQAPTWIGDANYVRVFTADPKFLQALRVTFFYAVFSVPLKLVFALGVAMLLNRGIKGLPIYRAIFYLPSLLGASVAIAVLWRELFSSDGVINKLLALVGIVGPSWISNPRYSLWTIVLLSVWQFGSPMIIFLAGLRQIPQDLYEAAAIDGASKGRQFWSVTLPMLTPVVFFNTIIQGIEAFKSFTPAFIISGGTGNPINSTLFYTLYLYQEAFAYFRMGYAATLAWILLIIIAAFTAISFLTSRYWVYYDE